MASDAAWVTVSNVACYGGPLVFTPKADPENQTFEVMVQVGAGRWKVVTMFWFAVWRWMTGAQFSMSGLSYHQGKRVKLASADGRPVPVQMDGDPGGHLPGDFEVVPGGIKVLAP